MAPTLCVAALADLGQQGAQVLEVEQQQALVVGQLEGDVEHALLRVVELQHAGEQQRAHFRDGRAHRMALFAEQIPENGREPVERIVGEADIAGALLQEILGHAHFRDAAEVALDVGGEDRHPGARKALGQHLQCYRLARAGGAGDQPVAVGIAQRQVFGPRAGAQIEAIVEKHGGTPFVVQSL
jgi:hypothetical protein